MLIVDEPLQDAFLIGTAFVDEGLRDQIFAEPAEGVLWSVCVSEGERGRERE